MEWFKGVVISRIEESEQTRFSGLTKGEVETVKKAEKQRLKNMGINIRGSWYGKITGLREKIDSIEDVQENEVIIIETYSKVYDTYIVIKGDNGKKLLGRLNNFNGALLEISDHDVFKKFNTYKVNVDTRLRKSKKDAILAMVCIAIVPFLELPQYSLTAIALNISAILFILKSNYLSS